MREVRSLPGQLVAGLGRRAQRTRNELRVRGQRLHNYAPMSSLVSEASRVAAAHVPAVDVHNHLGRWLNSGRTWMTPDVPALLATMDELNIATVVNLDGLWDSELAANLQRYDHRHPGRFLTFCHLDWSLLTDPRFPRLLPESLRRSATAGAGGLKVWKDLGLERRDASGHLVQLDDPRLSEVWETAAELSLPVLIHTADPVAFWQPADRRNERFEELARHPEWHHGSRRVPAHAELLRSFERLLFAHPGTTFIGAHVASHAEHLSHVSVMLERHPNLLIDVSAREAELGRQPRSARTFLHAHADRVLWGTDSFPFDADRCRTWFRILESADEHFPYGSGEVPAQGRWTVSGLDLDAEFLPALYADNARRIIPALRR